VIGALLHCGLTLVPMQALGSAHRAPEAHSGASGSVALMSRPFVLDAATAHELCPDGSRLRILASAPDASLVDPLEALGSSTPTLSVDADAPFAGDDAKLARGAASASCLVLEGGTWSTWWRLLEPSNKRTRLGQVVVERQARGGNIIGVGEAGLYLCAYSILSRAQLQIPSRDPHDTRAHVVVSGLGLVRDMCFDAPLDGRTTIEPLLLALRSSSIESAVWLSGSCAWIQAGEGPLARVVGSDGAAFVIDVGAGRRSRDAILDGGLGRLAPGACFDGRVTDHEAAIDPVVVSETLPLDADLSGFAWNVGGPDAEKPANSRKVIVLEGKEGRLRLLPIPGAGHDVPPPVHATRPDWIRFDWNPIASSGVETRVGPQVAFFQGAPDRGAFRA
jgi:hypothetical protein